MLAFLSDPKNVALAIAIASTLLALIKLEAPGGPLVKLMPLPPKATAIMMLAGGALTGFVGALQTGMSIGAALLVGFGTLGGSGGLIARKMHSDAQGSGS